MQRVWSSAVTCVLLSLILSPFVTAHGNEMLKEHVNGMGGHEVETSYWRHSQYAGFMYIHVLLTVVNSVAVVPIVVMLSIAKSGIVIPGGLVFLILNGIGVAASMIYNHKTPDLYENNAHHKLGWAVTWIATAWVIISLVRTQLYCGMEPASDQSSTRAVTRQAMAECQHTHDVDKSDNFRWSHDSGQGMERNTESLCSSSRSASMHAELEQLHEPQLLRNNRDDESEDDTQGFEKRGFLQDKSTVRILPGHNETWRANGLLSFNLAFLILERLMVMLGYVGLISGVVVYTGIFRGSNIFNGMAHFVKGGIFFWYGLLTFGRWLGCFADLGWAWNIRPLTHAGGSRRAKVPSAEFMESFVIFLYGASNVFMEHMAAWGEAWMPMDLEHVSISIMFFGGGLLGMLIESSSIRNVLNSAINKLKQEGDVHSNDENWQEPDSYVHSLNPLPALIILLLGIMMSSHTQHSHTSSAVHKQWGTMFVVFAIARAVTYVTLWLKPPKTYLPSRPPSEVITSFCLVSGGIIFMVSNKDSVAALEHYQLDSMFILTITIGFVCVLMAWVVVVVSMKGWAAKRERMLKNSL